MFVPPQGLVQPAAPRSYREDGCRSGSAWRNCIDVNQSFVGHCDRSSGESKHRDSFQNLWPPPRKRRGSSQQKDSTHEMEAWVLWMEEQVVSRLQQLDSKMDELKHRIDNDCLQLWQDSPSKTYHNGGMANFDLVRHAHGYSNGTSGLRTSLQMPAGETADFTLDAPSADRDLYTKRTAQDHDSDCQRMLPNNIDRFPKLTLDMSRIKAKEGLRTEAAGGSPPLSPIVSPTRSITSVESTRTKMSVRSSNARSSGETGAEVLQNRTQHQSSLRTQVFKFLDDSESGSLARWYRAAAVAFILVSLMTLLSTETENPPLEGLYSGMIEIVFETWFTMILALRFWSSPSRWNFLYDPYNIVDIATVVPLALRLSLGGQTPPADSTGVRLVERNFLICYVPVVRVFAVMRHFERFELLLNAFKHSAEALPVCVYTLFIMTITFASAVYLVEPRDNIDTYTTSMWFTIVTMTTVGYGDIAPSSTTGKLVTSMLVICSVLYMAMPLGIIGQAFMCVWNDRDQLLLLKNMRQRLKQWGYNAADIVLLFQSFDKNGDGELEVTEFQVMLKEMRIGLTDERARSLFASFDQDGSGSLDAAEFIKALFPGEVWHPEPDEPVEHGSPVADHSDQGRDQDEMPEGLPIP